MIQKNSIQIFGQEATDEEYHKNWDKIFSSYDGMYVAAGSSEILYYQFYGWDCDSICIFNKNIIIPL